jgi:hypothetical protein
MGKNVLTRILLSANPYSYEKKDGEGNVTTKEGMPIFYYSEDNLDPIKDEENGIYGGKISEDFLPYEEYLNLVEVPGIYELSFRMVNTRDEYKNRIEKLKITGLNFIGSLKPTGKV